MGQEPRAYLSATVKQQGENPLGQSAFPYARADGLPNQFASAWMRGMGLDNYRVSGSQGGSGVSSRDRERQREVAGSKYRNRPQRTQHGTNIGLGSWLARGLGTVDACPAPGTFLCDLSKETTLKTRAHRPRLQPRLRQSGFLVRPFDQSVGQRFDLPCDRPKNKLAIV